MPNDCYNNVTIVGNNDMIKKFIEDEMSFDKICPIPEEEKTTDYDDHCRVWGTKWDRYEYSLNEEGQSGLKCNFTTAWDPPIGVFEYLLKTYHDIWIKCEWEEEGGMAGVWIGHRRDGEPVIRQLEWQDLSIEEEDAIFNISQ